MAQEVIRHTYCDVHLLDKDEKVPGRTVPNPLDPSQEADLCEQDEAQLQTIVDSIRRWFDKYGRASTTPPPAKQAEKAQKPPPTNGRRRKRRDQLPLVCKYPGCTSGPDGGPFQAKRRTDLGHHMQNAHNTDLLEFEAQREDIYTPFACRMSPKTPNCPAAMGNIQGFAMHRSRKHGISMKETYEEFEEISKRVSQARKRGERWYPEGYGPVAAPAAEPATGPADTVPPITTSDGKTLRTSGASDDEDELGEPPPAQSEEELAALRQALEEESPIAQQASGIPTPRGIFH